MVEFTATETLGACPKCGGAVFEHGANYVCEKSVPTLAQVTPSLLRRFAPWLFVLGVVLLIVVDAIGYVGKGAQRWLDLGFIRFQPSEIMKLATPMMCAWLLHERPLPPDAKTLLLGSHIDTVRTGGRYDGNLGVLAGLEVIEVLEGAGIVTRRPLAVAFRP